MKEIYVKVLSEPKTDSILSGIGSVTWYIALWDGQEIIVNASNATHTLPSVGSSGLIRGHFYDQRFFDDSLKKLEIPYFLILE